MHVQLAVDKPRHDRELRLLDRCECFQLQGYATVTSVLRKLSFTITGMVGLTYAVGYLVSSMFYGAWGIHGTSLNFIRAQYVHVGFLCLMPPIVFSVLIVGGRWIIKQQLDIKTGEIAEDGKDKTKKLEWTKQGHATLVVLVLGLYLVALLAQRSRLVHDPWFQAAMILMPTLSVLGLFGVNLICKRFVKVTEVERVSSYLKHAILLFVLVCLGVMAYRLWDTIEDILGHQKLPLCLYSLLAFLVGVIGTHNVKNIVGVTRSEARPVIAAASICLVAPLMYFMVVSFAFGLFPYIPVSRGGADFTDARPVEISTVASGGSPTAFEDPTAQVPAEGKRVFIIEEAGDLMYIGRERKDSTAFDWRHRGNRPDLIVLNRKDIRSIRFLGDLNAKSAP